MPITKTTRGNLVTKALNKEFNVIIHGCNTQAVMGSGIAPQIAKAFKGVREADEEFNGGVTGHDRLGKFSIVVDKDVLVINSYIQNFMGCTDEYYPPISYKAIKESFRGINSLLEMLQREHRKEGREISVGIPMIGAGLAGGDWELISMIINDATPNVDITLVEYDGK